MPLKPLALAPFDGPIPSEVTRFLDEADRRIESHQVRGSPLSFVPSDYAGAYRVLRALAESNLPRGTRFCEWGCGFGVIAALAALLDFESSGIEIQADLVEEGRRLAEDFQIEVALVHGSFVPPGGERRVHTSGTYAWLTTEGDYAYEELGLDADDMDIIFAYPWPDEEAVTSELFLRYAGTGALLMTYHGEEDFRLHRKVAGRSKRP